MAYSLKTNFKQAQAEMRFVIKFYMKNIKIEWTQKKNRKKQKNCKKQSWPNNIWGKSQKFYLQYNLFMNFFVLLVDLLDSVIQT